MFKETKMKQPLWFNLPPEYIYSDEFCHVIINKKCDKNTYSMIPTWENLISYWYRCLPKLWPFEVEDMKCLCQSIYGIWVQKIDDENSKDANLEFMPILLYLENAPSIEYSFFDEIYLDKLRSKYRNITGNTVCQENVWYHILTSRYLNGRDRHG